MSYFGKKEKGGGSIWNIPRKETGKTRVGHAPGFTPGSLHLGTPQRR